MSRNALPVLAAGVVGLASGLLAVVMQAPPFGVVAGVLALAAAFGAMRLARALDEQSAVQALIEDELRKVRADAENAKSQIHQLDGSLSAHDTGGNGSQTNRQDSAAHDDSEFYEDGDDVDPLTDIDTGLFSESFFQVALESRVAAARRHLRPVSTVILQVVGGVGNSQTRPADARIVANAIRETLREADTACRLRNGDFALLLEDTPENGAIWTVERIRRRLVAETSSDPASDADGISDSIDIDELSASGPGKEPSGQPADKLTVWAGVACYPAHAFSTDELLIAASTALRSAQDWRQDRIEVAVPAPD